MQHVTFSAAMDGGLAHEKRLLPDDIAAKLHAEGKIAAMEPFPANATAPTPAARKPERPIFKPQRSVGTCDQRKAR